MPGSGKSVLAAESVRDASLTLEHFPGGVFWVKVGLVDQDQLLFRLVVVSGGRDRRRGRSSAVTEIVVVDLFRMLAAHVLQQLGVGSVLLVTVLATERVQVDRAHRGGKGVVLQLAIVLWNGGRGSGRGRRGDGGSSGSGRG